MLSARVSPLHDLSNLPSVMAFLTSVNVTSESENLVIFLNLRSIIFMPGWL